MHNAGSQPSTASKSSSDDSGLLEDGEEKDGEERDESEVGLDDFLQSPATKTRSYRPRSKTYTYIESGADPPAPPSQPSGGPGRGSQSLQFPDHSDRSVFVSSEQSPQQRHTFFDGQPSPSLPDPEISSPLTLPSPLSISR